MTALAWIVAGIGVVAVRVRRQWQRASVFLASFLAGAGPSPGEMIGASLTLNCRRPNRSRRSSPTGT